MAAATDEAKTYSYWLPNWAAGWVAEEAKAQDRSASWLLTQIIRAAMEAKRAEREPVA